MDNQPPGAPRQHFENLVRDRRHNTPMDFIHLNLPSCCLQRLCPRNDGVFLAVTRKGYHLILDVHQFRPNELSVKTIGNEIVFEARHGQRNEDNGLATRNITRRFSLPSGYNPLSVVCTLDLDGVLNITAPAPGRSAHEERQVEIHFTTKRRPRPPGRNNRPRHGGPN